MPLYGLVAAMMMLIFMPSCKPEMPVLSSITVNVDGVSVPVNQNLYGITLEEINHAIDGGIYAELIQNRSFEDGVAPLNCPYNAARNILITPNGWTVPFVRGDSIIGWRRLSANSQIYPDTKELINDRNRRSLLVAASASKEIGRGGVIAEGYKGIALKRGERYRLSFFMKGANFVPRRVNVALEDSSATMALSEIFTVEPAMEWRRYSHTFTANADTPNGLLTFSCDSSVMFWLDVVSLFPESTWKGRPNGLRADLAALVDSLSPAFIRFPGGSFVEGFTAGTFPVWRETVGDIATRRHFWNVWGYGSTNGMGYHEYLQMCEDMGAEPVYVVNSGITSQERRPRYEDITAMERLTNEALHAIAYANAPTDSTLGAMRAANGHPEPFGLKYIEVGSENFGHEYYRRFRLFREAIKSVYPDMIVISSDRVPKRARTEWVDFHYYSGSHFFFSNSRRFSGERYSRRSSSMFIGEFGTADSTLAGTLRAAVSEACFLIGVESNPSVVHRLAYAPLLGNVNFAKQRIPLISFNSELAVASPSYHLLKIFSRNRGNELLQTTVDTYEKPQVSTGMAGVEMFDNSFSFKDVMIDGEAVSNIRVLSGGWKVKSPGEIVPDANRWNRVMFGDSASYGYEYRVSVRRTKGSGHIQLRLRDNGKFGEQSDYVAMTIGSSECELYHQTGGVKDTLSSAVPINFESNRWYDVRMVCENEHIRCYIDGELKHEATMRPIPSLVSVATIDRESGIIYLKVVNTTMHEEKTSINIEGAGIASEAEVIELKGEPDARNTFDNPERIVPTFRMVEFPMGNPLIYNFPPNSVTILKLFV